MNMTFPMPPAANVPSLAREVKVNDVILNFAAKKITAVVETRFLDNNGEVFGNADRLPGLTVHQARGSSQDVDDFLDLEESVIDNPTAAGLTSVIQKILEFNNIIEPTE